MNNKRKMKKKKKVAAASGRLQSQAGSLPGLF
jgi:hypothetical protein